MTWPNRASSGPASRIEARILAHSAGIQCLRLDASCVHPNGIGASPLSRRAEIDEQREHRFDVANAGDIVEVDRTVGQHGGGEDRQGGILVAGGTHGPLQRATAVNQKTWRHGQS